MRKKKFGFITCVKLGLSCIEAIYSIGEKLDLVITLPDDASKNKSGRVNIDEFCHKNKIKLLKFKQINDPKLIKCIKEYEIDWLFIIGWSQIAKKELLEAPRFGSIGAHPTLLPQGRGRAPIPWAILKKLKKTGVSFFKIDCGVDSGPIIMQDEIIIDKEETAKTLYKKAELSHINIIKRLFPSLVKGHFYLKEQNHKNATYWPKRTPEEGKIDTNESIEEALLLIRALTKPYPGAFYFENNKKIIIWSAEKVLEKIDQYKYIDFHDGTLQINSFTYEI